MSSSTRLRSSESSSGRTRISIEEIIDSDPDTIKVCPTDRRRTDYSVEEVIESDPDTIKVCPTDQRPGMPKRAQDDVSYQAYDGQQQRIPKRTSESIQGGDMRKPFKAPVRPTVRPQMEASAITSTSEGSRRKQTIEQSTEPYGWDTIIQSIEVGECQQNDSVQSKPGNKFLKPTSTSQLIAAKREPPSAVSSSRPEVVRLWSYSMNRAIVYEEGGKTVFIGAPRNER